MGSTLIGRRGFLRGLLGVSAAAVCAEKFTLAPETIPKVSKTGQDDIGLYGGNAMQTIREHYQEQLSREMALRLDNLILEKYRG